MICKYCVKQFEPETEKEKRFEICKDCFDEVDTAIAKQYRVQMEASSRTLEEQCRPNPQAEHWERQAYILQEKLTKLGREGGLFAWAYDRLKILMDHSNHEYAIKEARTIDAQLEKELAAIREEPLLITDMEMTGLSITPHGLEPDIRVIETEHECIMPAGLFAPFETYICDCGATYTFSDIDEGKGHWIRKEMK